MKCEKGGRLRTAIETGWVRSRKTILAADSVSLLSALVLFILAVGAVKGFAFTLGLTTIIDIVVVVFTFTKPLMTLLGKTKFYGEGHRFSGFEAEHMGASQPAVAQLAAQGRGDCWRGDPMSEQQTPVAAGRSRIASCGPQGRSGSQAVHR